MVAGERPSDPEIAKSLSLAGVFDWYPDCPEQIERAAFTAYVTINSCLLIYLRLNGADKQWLKRDLENGE
jgi:hypothetical protein